MMCQTKTKRLTCPNCKEKIAVVIDPLPERVSCTHCNAQLKVVKKFELLATSSYSMTTQKECCFYHLQIIDNN